MRIIVIGMILTIVLSYGENQPPICPESIITQLYGDTTYSIDFTVQTADPDQDKISYQFDWGDGTISEWTDFIQSNYVHTVKYIYKNIGAFLCRVRARDEQGNTTDWSVPCSLTIVPNLLKWQFDSQKGIHSSVAIGPRKEIYLTCDDGSLQAVSSDGSWQWTFPALFAIYSAPVVDKNGIYVTATDGKLYAIDFSGKERWRFNADNAIYSSPALGKDGTIYFGCDDGKIYAVSPHGKELWSYLTGDEIAGSPVIDSDGMIYVGSDALYALTPKGKIKWIFRPPEENDATFFASPIIDADGTIYIGGTDGALYAITKNGRLKWIAPTPDEDAIRAASVIDQRGTIYFGAEDGWLYRKEFYGEVIPVFETDYYIYSTPAIDTLGNIYLVSDDGYLYCVRQDGKLLFKWMLADDSKEIMYSPSPIIDIDGTVYVGSWQGKLFAFKGFAPLAQSPWPIFRLNLQNTARKEK